MRCTSVKEYKCWNGIESELTSNSIRLLIDLLHIDVVNLSFLKRIGLVRSFNFLLRALISIMPQLLAFEALNLTDVLFDILTSTSTTISTVVALMSTLVVLVLIIVMTTVFVVMTVVVVVLVELPMFMGSRAATVIIVRSFVRRSRAVFVGVFPLSTLDLLHFTFQNSSLVTQRLISWNICHRQLQIQLIIQAFQKFFLPFGICVNLIRCIARQIVELFYVFCHAAVALFQVVKLLLFQTHHS